jgi:glycosyltransferase involved in cell wall biosynthesis
MTQPLVSIVLPTRNGSRYLNESLQSIVDQTWTNWELIVVNDGSTDDTGRMIDTWAAKDTRIRAVHLKTNVGVPSALNRGFAEAQGEYFTWTSDDNRYRPAAIERFMIYLQSHPDVDLVYSDWSKIDAAGQVLEKVRVLPPEALPQTNCVGGSFLFRRALFEALGGYATDLFLAEDYDFWLRAFSRFQLAALHEDLYEYRIHEAMGTLVRRRESREVAVQTLLRWIETEPRPSPQQRMRALLQCSDLAWNNRRPLAAQWLLWRAMWEGGSPFFFPGGRLHAVDALFSIPVGKVLRRLGRASGRLYSRSPRSAQDSVIEP